MMNIAYFTLTFFVLCTVLTALATKFAIKLLNSYGIVDQPGNRRSHKKATPRGGGIAIFLIFTIGFIYLDLIFKSNYSFRLLPYLTFLALVSFYDDIKGTNAFLRLVVHLFVASYALYNFLYPNNLFHGELDTWLDFTLATIGFAGFVNIYNFLDGIDGITSMQSIHLSIAIITLTILRSDVIYHPTFIMMIALITLACSIGFLIYNWSPASVFLGDVGSISLGFLLGLCLVLIAASGERLFVASAISSLYYIADGGGTLLIRIIKREKVWLPHLNHFFQQAVKKGMSHKEVTLKIAFCNLILLLLAVNALFYPAICIIAAIFVVMCILIHFSK
ncbi:MAG: undecaprenyl-phosphate alpha-N-acetylglucosaminyltransferase [Rickettsiaceae bacterium]|jgi:UDP-N-acetylmuramyl pentapeptide phosphotransferase/UDP-N-acetylglucosamine-1-phosphate transferase|nr:undecaprenyl-phosphate alpha-N-acetylglucosaminyltransferase [Rickettsiaceae bacterium]